jgi:hypothetical protein
MVERRDVLRGATAFAAVSLTGGTADAAGADDGALDLALERFSRTGPEYRGGLANHGPMAAEALAALGRPDAVAGWVDAYIRRLEPSPPSSRPIAPGEWAGALGQRDRAGDWAALFRRAVAEAPWRDVLRTWVPRLAPGFVGAATHGAIRTGHAARALERRETPPRVNELAEGLAYWAATFARLPESRTPEGEARPSEALAGLDLLPADERRPFGFITDRLSGLARFPPFAEVASRVSTSGDPSAFLSDLTAAFARVYLENAPDPGKVITFVHAVTGPSSARLLLPYVDAAGARSLLRYGWQAAAALYVAMGDRVGRRPSGGGEPPGPPALVERAVDNGDEHAIKFVEACLREEALHPDPHFRRAAADALGRLG